MTFGPVLEIPQTFPVFKRERAGNMYSTTSFYFAKISVAFIRYLIYPFFLTFFSVWFFGLPLTPMTVFGWWGVLTLVALVFSAFGFVLGCILPYSERMAPVVGEAIFSLMAMGAGFVINA